MLTSTPKVSELSRHGGFTLLEVMVALFVLVAGLLGLAGLQSVAGRANVESYQRAQALILLDDIQSRMNANRKSAHSFETGGGWLGTSASATCGTTALADCVDWSNMLQGAAETSANNTKVGGMIGARGCITYDASTELAGLPDTGYYTMTVVWQGLEKSFIPPATNTCGLGEYGDPAQRRLVSRRFRIARLL